MLPICPVKDDRGGKSVALLLLFPSPGLGELKITSDTLHLPNSQEEPPGKHTH